MNPLPVKRIKNNLHPYSTSPIIKPLDIIPQSQEDYEPISNHRTNS